LVTGTGIEPVSQDSNSCMLPITPSGINPLLCSLYGARTHVTRMKILCPYQLDEQTIIFLEKRPRCISRGALVSSFSAPDPFNDISPEIQPDDERFHSLSLHSFLLLFSFCGSAFPIQSEPSTRSIKISSHTFPGLSNINKKPGRFATGLHSFRYTKYLRMYTTRSIMNIILLNAYRFNTALCLHIPMASG
jgi:hypothetical protein